MCVRVGERGPLLTGSSVGGALRQDGIGCFVRAVGCATEGARAFFSEDARGSKSILCGARAVQAPDSMGLSGAASFWACYSSRSVLFCFVLSSFL